MKNPMNVGRRGRHRRRWTATGLLLGVPAIVVPYLLYAQEDSQAATIDGSAYYRLVSVRSGKVLDVNGFSTADGTRIQQWTDQNTANQQWRLRPTGDGYYELVNRNSGKVLGIAGNSPVDGAAAEQQTDSSSTAQEWKIKEVSGSGAVTFTSRRSGQVLDVSGGSTADGAAVDQYPSRGSTNQQWKLVKTAGSQASGAGTARPRRPDRMCGRTPRWWAAVASWNWISRPPRSCRASNECTRTSRSPLEGSLTGRASTRQTTDAVPVLSLVEVLDLAYDYAAHVSWPPRGIDGVVTDTESVPGVLSLNTSAAQTGGRHAAS
jgi:hypothetical protein